MDYALLSIKWPLASLAVGFRAVLTCLGALLGLGGPADGAPVIPVAHVEGWEGRSTLY